MKNRGFERILLATDGSDQAEAATHLAAALAESSSASVRVVHCWNLEVHHRHGAWDVETRSEAEELIGEAVRHLRTLDVEADGRLMHSDHDHVGHAIAEAAREFNADLVVVGSRGLSDWRSLFQHSVSHEVLRAVDCPVLIVREDAASMLHEPSRVLVAVAGGDDLAPAIRAAAAAASTPGSKVLVTHVVQALFGPQGVAYVESDEEAGATIEAAVSMLRDAGIRADGKIADPGPVARTVADIALQWQADVIVIGSSRMSDVASLMFGSVTHDLLRSSRRPVLVAERSDR